MKRLPTLPEGIRREWKPKTILPSTVRAAVPEEFKGQDWIHDWETTDRAELDLEGVSFHRGKARAGKGNETLVFVMAVYRFKVVAYLCGKIQRTYAEEGDPYRAHRQKAISEMEFDLAKSLGASLLRTTVTAKSDLEAAKHRALPTTKLVALRRRIASMESVLAELRVEEAELVDQAYDESSR